jgi:hypothetical protein
MPTIYPGRYASRIEGPFVVFLIGNVGLRAKIEPSPHVRQTTRAFSLYPPSGQPHLHTRSASSTVAILGKNPSTFVISNN